MATVRLCIGTFIFLNLFVCYNFYTKDTVPDIEDQKFIDECIHAHNNFRSNVKPPASDMKRMSWDDRLARVAQGWVGKCIFQHNLDLLIPYNAHPQFAHVGENIWAGTLPKFNVTTALTSWFDEIENYEFDTQLCHKICAHYTQLVWATTYKVGCAAQFCATLQNFTEPDAVLFVCDYGPAGNYPTQPYKTGAPCSACRKRSCQDNLCDSDGSEQCRISPSLLVMTVVIFLFNINNKG